jgi:hypothetical protein
LLARQVDPETHVLVRGRIEVVHECWDVSFAEPNKRRRSKRLMNLVHAGADNGDDRNVTHVTLIHRDDDRLPVRVVRRPYKERGIRYNPVATAVTVPAPPPPPKFTETVEQYFNRIRALGWSETSDPGGVRIWFPGEAAPRLAYQELSLPGSLGKPIITGEYHWLR